MSVFDLNEAVAIEGGCFYDYSISSIVPERSVSEVHSTIEFMQELFGAHMHERPKSGEVVIVLTRSTALSCRTRNLKDGSDVILVPIGMIAGACFKNTSGA
jgi:hypothetical protein